MVKNMDKTVAIAARLSRQPGATCVRNCKYFAIHSKIYRKIVAKISTVLYNIDKYFLGVKICN